jgi:hypothetical protein
MEQHELDPRDRVIDGDVVPPPPPADDPTLAALERIACALEGIRGLLARPPAIPVGNASPLIPLLGDATSIAEANTLTSGVRRPRTRA